MKPGLYMHFLTGQCYEIQKHKFTYISYICQLSAKECTYFVEPKDNLSFLVYIGKV